MKMLPLIFLLTSFDAFAGGDKICKEHIKTRTFISEWREADGVVNILTNIHGLEISRERGRVAYRDDFNGDSNVDYIFESFDSEGSAKDRTHGIYIQCKGFLKFVGGDYFAEVNGVKASSGNFKDIVFLSYQRNESGEVIYANGQALTKLHAWSFNQKYGRYEGDTD